MAPAEADPAYIVHRRPLLIWATAIWDGTAPMPLLQSAVKLARAAFVPSNPWLRARGPASGLLATLRRIGWDMLTATVLVEHTGVQRDLRSTCPATL